MSIFSILFNFLDYKIFTDANAIFGLRYTLFRAHIRQAIQKQL